MKKFLIGILAMMIFNISIVAAKDEPMIEVVKENIRYCESVYPYEGGLLISNFGSESINPEEDENEGYILRYTNGMMQTLIPADGRLHKPTAMAIQNNFLFVCDADKLKIFDMKDLKADPQEIEFASDDEVINDIAIQDNKAYVTVTNSGRVYTLDITDPKNISEPQLWAEIPGPNGIAIRKDVAYVVSIPADYSTVTTENIIYKITNLADPIVERFYDVPGLYDGVAFSNSGNHIYVTDWQTASVRAIGTAKKTYKIIYREAGIGPADLAIANGKIYIPDLINSRVIIIPANL